MYCPVCHADYPGDWKVCPKDEATLLRSKQIGKYAIEGLLGVGGMGAVYRAVNPDTKGAVAIKVMNASVAGSDQARQRFQREAAVVAKLRTSHVVKIYDFGAESDGTMFLVMELLDGHALRDEITAGPDYMDLARVHMVMDGALKGLGAAHKAGIVHRDLKPENIHIAETDDGEVPKLLDFGIARVRTKESDLTRTGSLMGTASYMAPEQITAGHAEIGAWSDVYAMGAILYEMLTGAACFGGNTVTEVLQRVLRSEHVPLAAVRAGLPDAVYKFVERCLDPVAANRPQDAEAMRMGLAGAQLVAPGVVIPPANNTRPDRSRNISTPGLEKTYGVNAAVPAPVSQSAERSAPVVMPYVPAKNTTPSQPAVTPPPADRSSPAIPVAGPPAGQATKDLGATAPPEPKKKSMMPLALVGVVVLGGGAAIAVKMAGGATPATPPAARKDAGVVAVVTTPDAAPAPAPDAAVVAAKPGSAAPPGGSALIPAKDDPRSAMIHNEARERDLGEKKAENPASLPAQHLAIGELWIDPTEMTLGDFRAATKSKTGGQPGDTVAMPARSITYAQAEAACKALGKRLPTEQEWESAALDTKEQVMKATLKQALVPSKHAECSYDGLCDMLGSLAEWTASDFTQDGKKIAGQKSVRGSDFSVSPKAGWAATTHARSGQAMTEGDTQIGFRCVMDPATH